MRIFIAIACILFLYRLCVSSLAQTTQASATAPQKESAIPWEDVLWHYGPVLNLYFSIEVDDRHDDSTSPLDKRSVLEVPEIKTSDQMVEWLQKTLPEAEVFTNAQNPKIVHIVEKSLMSDKDYVLNHRENLNFAGDLEDLAGELRKQSSGAFLEKRGGVFSSGAFALPVEPFIVHIDVENATYREILCTGLPLEKYTAILWKTESYFDGSHTLRAAITFYGPRMRLNPPTTETSP